MDTHFIKNKNSLLLTLVDVPEMHNLHFGHFSLINWTGDKTMADWFSCGVKLSMALPRD